MKKIIFLFLFFSVVVAVPALAAGRVAVLLEETQETANGIPTRDEKRTTRLFIPNVAGSGEADRAVGGLEKKLLGTKKSPGGAIGGIKDSVDSQAGQIGTLAENVQQNTDAVNALNGEVQKTKGAVWDVGNALLEAIKAALGRTLLWIILALAVATAILAVLILRRKRPQTPAPPVSQSLPPPTPAQPQTGHMITGTKKKGPVTLRFTAGGRAVKYRCPIRNNKYEWLGHLFNHRSSLIKAALEDMEEFFSGTGPNSKRRSIQYARAIRLLKY